MELKANWKDMREFLAYLEERGKLDHVKEEMDPEWEVNYATRATLQKLGPALYFENIKGMDYPMVAGMLAEDSRFLAALGLES